ncbi:MAG TPA: cadmium-translocating P-type ATPase [Erysipelotrichaceae bacterium]|nr:cadmium-translocating P-type ATPase [Erysipelotrichaceae bacterium]
MTDKIYHISGFDCPSCANKVEMFLSKQEDIEKCHIDFSTNKMFITFKKNILSIEELLVLISKVESDPIFLKESSRKISIEIPKLFTKEMRFLLVRIVFALVVVIANMFILNRFDDSGWIRFTAYLLTTTILIYDVAWKVILHLKNRQNIIDHNLLIVVAVLGATVLSIIYMSENDIDKGLDFIMEGTMVTGLFQIGQIVEKFATNKSKLAVTNAIQLRVEYANLIKNDAIVKVNPEQLVVGDVVVISAGEMIPIDGEVMEGNAYINKSSLTGESTPVLVDVKNKEVFAGFLVESGFIKVKVLKKYEDSAVSKIVELIASSGGKKSKADGFIARFARIYTPIIVLLSIAVFLIGGLITSDWRNYFLSGLEILVTGCPCAIVISVPLAFFAAIGLASKRGIVIKGTSYLDEINRIGKVISDKTGTLTKGIFSIQKISPVKGVKKEELLESLYAAECLSTHPIARTICHDIDVKSLAAKQVDFKETTGLGVTTVYEGKRIYAGNISYIQQTGIAIKEVKEKGIVIYCQKEGKYLGYIVLNDEIKEEVHDMIKLFHKEKIEVILLTGDKKENASILQKELGIDYIYSELTPSEKVELLEKEMLGTNKNVAFVGDGINDAPSIKRSDVGFAMGAIGSDIAVQNADVVIMNDNPIKVYESIRIARIAKNTAIFNIVFALLIKIIVAILVIIPTINIPMKVPIIADTGLTVVLVINSLLVLYRPINLKKK